MKGFKRQNQFFSLCGLNCGLCPMFLNKTYIHPYFHFEDILQSDPQFLSHHQQQVSFQAKHDTPFSLDHIHYTANRLYLIKNIISTFDAYHILSHNQLGPLTICELHLFAFPYECGYFQ